MRHRLHRLQDAEGKGLSYSALARKLLGAEGLSEAPSRAILEPLLEANPQVSRDGADVWILPEDCLRSRFLADVTFAVVDIETTGGRPPQHRITELAAVRVRGGRVVEEFDALVNPGREIPWSVVRLTGITDAMVAGRPGISEVLPGFLDFISGSAFVAHCASFDFHFIRYFARELLGRELAPPILCTFKLAQRLLPEAGRYNLGELGAYLGLAEGAQERHRALGDARATARILLRLLRMLQLLGLETLDQVLAHQEPLPKEPPPLAEGLSIDPAVVEDLPAERGVFRLVDGRDRTVYAGRAADIRRAVRDLFYPRSRSGARFAQRLHAVEKVEARTLESELGMSIRAARLARDSRLMNGASPGAGAGFLKIGLASKFPRVYASHRLVADGSAYYGPFRRQVHLQDLIGAIHSVFPLRRLARSGKDGAEEGERPAGPPPLLSPELYAQLIEGLQRMLEGRLGQEEEGDLLALLGQAWSGSGPSSARLRRQTGRLRRLIQSHGLSGPSVERRDLIIVEPGETRQHRVCYFVRRGLLAGEMEFARSAPPVEALAARIREVFFAGGEDSAEPGKESMEEAAIIAAWLRRELMEGFIVEISPAAGAEEVLQALLTALRDPEAAGTTVSA